MRGLSNGFVVVVVCEPFSIQNLENIMKMTWLHIEFVLIFITGPS